MNPFPIWFTSRAFTILLAGLVWISPPALAQDAGGTTVEIGFADQFKLGHWSPLVVRNVPASAHSIVITCRDSDDAMTSYQAPLIRDPDHPQHAQSMFRLGRIFGTLAVRILDRDKAVIWEDEIGVRNDLNPSSSTRQMLLTIEPEGGIANRLAASSIRLNEEDLLIAAPTSAGTLPFHWRQLDGVDTLFLLVDDGPLLESISDQQLQAIVDWVKNGGHLIISAGVAGQAFLTSNPMGQQLVPGEVSGTTELTASSRIEFFSNSKNRLIRSGNQPIKVLQMEPADANVLLEQDGVPLLIQQARGFGRLTFVALDLTSEPFTSWEDNNGLIRQILFPQAEVLAIQRQENSSKRVSHYGYEDMTGQLRVPLGQFSRVRFIRFTFIALLIGLYILCVGPGDYFFLRKVVGKMEYTWITFTLITLLFCGLAYWGAVASKPKSIQVNQVELIDVDLAGNRARSTSWINLFSPSSESIDLAFSPADPFSTGAGGGEFQPAESSLSWLGLPGKGLGGMQSNTVSGIPREPYVHLNDDSSQASAVLKSIPFQVSSSKTLFGQWYGDNQLKLRNGLRLVTSTRSRQLQGTLTSQLDVRLDNCRLFFDDWVYVFDRPIEPGETVDIRFEAKEKNLKSYMTRRVNQEGKSVSASWSPTDADVARIMNMLMFFEAAGGASYTSLSHDYQSFTDLTPLLPLNRAMLVGEVTGIGTRIEINGQPVEDGYDSRRTFVRIVLPIEQVTRGTTASTSTNQTR